MDASVAGLLALLVASVALTIEGERRAGSGGRVGRIGLALALTTVVASTCVLVLAWRWGAWGTAYGLWTWTALCLCWVGDVLRRSVRRGLRLAGRGSLLVAHGVFFVAFGVLGPTTWVSVGTLAFLLGVLWFLALAPIVGATPKRLRKPVVAYLAAVALMVASAAGAAHATAEPLVLLGALLFLISDLFAARQWFIQRDWRNRLVELPLYYGAVVLLAYSVTLLG